MTWPRRALVAGVLVALLAPPASVAAQGVDPVVHLDRTGTIAGDTMLVTGDSWPESSSLVVELCGHGGLRGSSDCDVANQRTVATGSSGTFGVELAVGKPPVPCPCVVKVTDQGAGIAATAPIAVAGIPTVPITAEDAPAARVLEVSSIRISGGGTIAELFGAGGRRVLEVTVVNTGAVAVTSPSVSVAFGRGGDPTGFVPPPDIAPMEPGDSQTLTVPLDRAPMTLGRQTAVVEIQGVGEEPVVARATTGGYPWGLLAILLVVVQLVLLRARRWIRRRTGIDEVGDERGDERAALPPGLSAPLALPVGAGPPGGHAPAGVIDLRDQAPTPLDGPSGAPDAVPTSGSAEAARSDLRRAIERSQALVAASTARGHELEAQLQERLRVAAARQAASEDLLEQARERADELFAVATEAASATLREAEAERAAARRERAEAAGVRAQSVASAWAVLEALVREHGATARPDVAPVAEASRSAPVARRPPTATPRLGGVEASIARAVSRAFAAPLEDQTLVD